MYTIHESFDSSQWFIIVVQKRLARAVRTPVEPIMIQDKNMRDKKAWRKKHFHDIINIKSCTSVSGITCSIGNITCGDWTVYHHSVTDCQFFLFIMVFPCAEAKSKHFSSVRIYLGFQFGHLDYSAILLDSPLVLEWSRHQLKNWEAFTESTQSDRRSNMLLNLLWPQHRKPERLRLNFDRLTEVTVNN